MNDKIAAPSIVGGLVASSILVDLSVSVWVGRKLDKKNTKKIVSDNNATTRDAALVTKKLFADNKLLEEVSRRANKVRTYVDDVTLPWMAGTKLLPMTAFLNFQQRMAALSDEFYEAVEEFLKDYDIQVSAMAFKLGSLFDRTEYPDADTIRSRCRMSWDFMPLPTAGDFRVDAEQMLCNELQLAYEAALKRKIEDSMESMWQRLKECLDHLMDRLGSTDGKNNIFRDSLMQNALELVNLLKDFNIAKDPKMEQARQLLLAAIDGVEPEELRKNENVREDVRKSVSDILSKFAF